MIRFIKPITVIEWRYCGDVVLMCDCECKNCKKATILNVPDHEFHRCLTGETEKNKYLRNENEEGF